MSAASTAASLAATTTTTTKKQVDFQEVQETVNRLAAHKGVTAVLILNSEGDILTQTGKEKSLVGNPKLLKQMLDAAGNYVRSIPKGDDDEDGNKDKEDDEEQLSFVRIRSKQEEILVAPKNNYVLVVLQDPNLAPL
jgi:dynein light chain roadblock-type